MLQCPVHKVDWRVLHAIQIGHLDIAHPLPAHPAQVGAMQIRVLKIGIRQIGTFQIDAIQRRIGQIRSAQVCFAQTPAAEVRSSEIRLGQVAAIKHSLPNVSVMEVRSHQACVLEFQAGQVCSRHIHARQRHLVVIQLLQCIDTASASTFALRRVDHLPRLVVPLLYARIRFREIEDDRDQDREAADILQRLQKCPIAQQVNRPFENVLECEER